MDKNWKSCKGKRAFTLAEVLVVVTIIAILSGLAASSLRDKVEVDAVKGDVVMVRSFLDEVSARSRTRGKNHCMYISSDTLYYKESSDCSGTVAGKIGLGSRTTFRAGGAAALPSIFTGTLVNWAATGSKIQFMPGGIRLGLNPLATNGYLVIESKRRNTYRGIVGKIGDINKPVQFISLNGGGVWQRL